MVCFTGKIQEAAGDSEDEQVKDQQERGGQGRGPNGQWR